MRVRTTECPGCQSTTIEAVDDHGDEELFECADCGHKWWGPES